MSFNYSVARERRLILYGPAHPFTIANSPELDSLTSKDSSQGLTLYAKNCGDFTNDLHQVACQYGGFGDAEKGDSEYLENAGIEVKLSIEGPYGGSHTRELAPILSYIVGTDAARIDSCRSG